MFCIMSCQSFYQSKKKLKWSFRYADIDIVQDVLWNVAL